MLARLRVYDVVTSHGFNSFSFFLHCYMDSDETFGNRQLFVRVRLYSISPSRSRPRQLYAPAVLAYCAWVSDVRIATIIGDNGPQLSDHKNSIAVARLGAGSEIGAERGVKLGILESRWALMNHGGQAKKCCLQPSCRQMQCPIAHDKQVDASWRLVGWTRNVSHQ